MSYEQGLITKGHIAMLSLYTIEIDYVGKNLICVPLHTCAVCNHKNVVPKFVRCTRLLATSVHCFMSYCKVHILW